MIGKPSFKCSLKYKGLLWGSKWDKRYKNDLWTVQHDTALTSSRTNLILKISDI